MGETVGGGEERFASSGSVRATGGGAEQLREKLLQVGANALTDSELMALLFGASRRGQSPRALAETLLETGGGLRALLQEDPHELCARPGLGPSRAAQVLAALELGKRAQRTSDRRPKLRTPVEIDAYLRPQIALMRREVFHVLCFNSRNVLLRDVRVAEGTTNLCPVDPREVFATAINCHATGIVLAHNHPSGDPQPSTQDVALTRQLAEGARILGLRMLDHIVLGESGFVSFLEHGLLDGKLRTEVRSWAAGNWG